MHEVGWLAGWMLARRFRSIGFVHAIYQEHIGCDSVLCTDRQSYGANEVFFIGSMLPKTGKDWMKHWTMF